jgi:hypothetical protein
MDMEIKRKLTEIQVKQTKLGYFHSISNILKLFSLFKDTKKPPLENGLLGNVIVEIFREKDFTKINMSRFYTA